MAAIDEQEYTKSFDWGIWKRLTPFLKPFRRLFVGMLVFNGLTALVDVLLPLFQRYAISHFIEANTLHGLAPYGLCYFLVVLVQALACCCRLRRTSTSTSPRPTWWETVRTTWNAAKPQAARRCC